MKEEWRDIKGYEGLYQVSNLGRVKSLVRNTGNQFGKEEYILKSRTKNHNYLEVALSKNGNKKFYTIHRLVALHFIPNPNNYPVINHKDENPRNNRVDNLEWCTIEYNNYYGSHNKNISDSLKGRFFSQYTKDKMSKNHADFSGSKNGRARKVQCITTGKKFDCIKEAAEFYSINKKSLGQCCRGKLKSAGKHPVTGEKLIWRYIDDRGNK